MQHYGAVLANRIKQHRPLGFGDDLAEDLDALRLELLEMAESARFELEAGAFMMRRPCETGERTTRAT